jgi:hypothetical protein
MRPLVALVALVAAMAALLIAYNASPARAADDNCSTTTGTTTCTFAYTGSEQTFEVPLGVSTIHVEATGAPGAVGTLGGTAGRGAQVSGDLTVTPGQLLYVNVGGAPTNVLGTCIGGVACVGGFNGGGSSVVGGGGGGASDVRTVSSVQSGSLDSRLIVAGGGGGSGEGRFCGYPVSPLLLGGTGGDAGSDGGDGADGALCVNDRSLQTGDDPVYTAGGTGGEAGSQSAGGLGGSPLGQSGSLGLGGNGGALVIGGIGSGIRGGGGGGGLFGGGGGGSVVLTPDIRGDAAPAGGGGGGSNLVPPVGTASVPVATTGPSVTISYTDQADTTPPTVTTSTPTNKADDITATFSELVKNVTFSTFFLERQIAAKVKKDPPKYVLVDATVTLSVDPPSDRIYVLDPVKDLPKGNYRATITTDVTDMADNALEDPEVWTFTVAK